MNSLEITKEIAKILDEKKGEDIKALAVKELTTLGDYFVIASGNSAIQVQSLCDAVDEHLGKLGILPKRTEGYQTATWILLDYYDVLVHIFQKETRDFYSLERLWSDAPQVDLSDVLTD